MTVVPLTVKGESAAVFLTKGKRAFIDIIDWPLVGHLKWYAEKSKRSDRWYAAAKERGTGRYLSMHRLICGEPDGLDVDHIDHDGLNNRRSNLRVCTRAQNLANARAHSDGSGHKGVWLRKDTGKWQARITQNGKRTNVGNFATAEEASLAYQATAKRLCGEFAPRDERKVPHGT